MQFGLPASKMNQLVTVSIVLYSTMFIMSVYCDVSSLDGIKTFPSTTASTNAENSNSFSILTKEFLNKPDDSDFKRDKPRPPNNGGNNGVRNLAPYPMIRVNGLDANNLGESDGDGERRAYYYDKPSISFEDEDKGGASSNVQTSTLAPKRDELEDFGGYHYPKPAIPFPPPTTTADPDVESLSGGPARLTNG